MTTINYILLFVLILQSCLSKDESRVNVGCSQNCLTFNVKVTTGLNSQMQVAGAYVDLGWNRPATPLGNTGRLLAKGYTNENGEGSFNFSPDERELSEGQFYVTVTKDNSFYKPFNSYYGIQTVDTTFEAKVHLPSKALVKIIYKNFSPTSPRDYFNVTPGFYSYGSSGFAVEQLKSNNLHNYWFTGSEPAFERYEILGQTAGDQYTTFDIIIKKNGQRIDRRDSTYIN